MELIEFVFIALALFISLSIHEVSHGLAAYYLGDPTAKLRGRLTLNPISHLDVMGAIVFLVTRTIGWAKPVPVNPNNFKNPVKDMALTAFAGPFSNLVLAFFLSVFLRYVGPYIPMEGYYMYFISFVWIMFHVNIVLAIFNLLPLPPLDGSKVLGLFVPSVYRSKYLSFLANGQKYFLAIILFDVFILGNIVGFSVFGLVMGFLRGKVELLLLLGM